MGRERLGGGRKEKGTGWEGMGKGGKGRKGKFSTDVPNSKSEMPLTLERSGQSSRSKPNSAEFWLMEKT